MQSAFCTSVNERFDSTYFYGVEKNFDKAVHLSTKPGTFLVRCTRHVKQLKVWSKNLWKLGNGLLLTRKKVDDGRRSLWRCFAIMALVVIQKSSFSSGPKIGSSAPLSTLKAPPHKRSRPRWPMLSMAQIMFKMLNAQFQVWDIPIDIKVGCFTNWFRALRRTACRISGFMGVGIGGKDSRILTLCRQARWHWASSSRNSLWSARRSCCPRWSCMRG